MVRGPCGRRPTRAARGCCRSERDIPIAADVRPLTRSQPLARMSLILLRCALVLCALALAVAVAEGVVRSVPAPTELLRDRLVPDDGTLPPGKSWFDPDWG